jgi:hypothetical protein
MKKIIGRVSSIPAYGAQIHAKRTGGLFKAVLGWSYRNALKDETRGNSHEGVGSKIGHVLAELGRAASWYAFPREVWEQGVEPVAEARSPHENEYRSLGGQPTLEVPAITEFSSLLSIFNPFPVFQTSLGVI